MDMKKTALIVLCLCLVTCAALAEGALSYRFADADEAAALRLSNRNYFDNLNQNDLNYRMQKTDATLEEYEAYSAAQMLDFTEAEKAAVDSAVAHIEEVSRERGYRLPATDGIVFCKSTMADECGAGGYTHGTQIYLGEGVLNLGLSDNPEMTGYFREIVTHEVFHCLTRNHPEFRAAMYAILGFTVTGKDVEFGPSVRELMISNPDVEHHDAYATFEIDGKRVDCVTVFLSAKPFERPGDSFFSGMVTGLVPVDDPDTLYTSEDAANFFDVFGRNTEYVIDPEETMADNFSYVIMDGAESPRYNSPDIPRKIDAWLKGEAD